MPPSDRLRPFDDAAFNFNVFLFHDWQGGNWNEPKNIQKRSPVLTEFRLEIQNGLVATTTAAATTTAVSTVTTTAAARGAFFTRLGNVDCEGTTVHILPVQAFDGLLRLLGGTHGDETKTARTAGVPVHHQVGFHDRAERGKRGVQVIFGGIEGEVSDK
jgi:hypothetical protein